MGFTDAYYYGQCKIICEAETVADNGRTVSISDGNTTQSAALVNKIAEFLVPGRSQYTITLLDGNVTKFTTKIEVGYGECAHVILANGYQPVIKKDFDASINALSTRVGTAETNITTNKNNISGLTTRMGTAESGISSNKTNITNLTTRMGTAETNISNAKTQMGTFLFGKDANGNPAYKKDGADTWHPFRLASVVKSKSVGASGTSSGADQIWATATFSFTDVPIYKSLTAADFGTWVLFGFYIAGGDGASGGHYFRSEVQSYNSSTGVLTVKYFVTNITTSGGTKLVVNNVDLYAYYKGTIAGK